MIPLDVTILWHPKDTEHHREYEDACAIGRHGIAAIADGVSEAIFSRQWAKILTAATIEAPVQPSTIQWRLESWLSRARERWQEQITKLELSWMQRQKLQAVRGAYSTLLWIEFPVPDADSGTSECQLPFCCRAVGDCCLFQIRDGRLLRSFPLTQPEEFERDPVTICSVQWRPDSELTFASMDGCLQTGDTIVLSSDAFAKWALQAIARKEEINWDRLEGLDSSQWSEWVSSVRDHSPDQRMRVDDTTLIFIRPQFEQDRNQSCDSTLSATALLPAIVVHERVVPACASHAESNESEIDESYAIPQEVVKTDCQLAEAESSEATNVSPDDQSPSEPSQSDSSASDDSESANSSSLQAIDNTAQDPVSLDSRSESSRESKDEPVVTRIWRSLRRRD